MKIKSAELALVCGVSSALPRHMQPEIAFIGRSNVGKSSMMNALLGRKSLARTSQTPGKTQTINYYLINKELFFVDLPGYGYAKVSQTTREQWGKMIGRYLKRSPSLKAVFLLIDIRHEPGANDREMYDKLIADGISPFIIATKSDKIPKAQVAKQVSLIRKTLGCPSDMQIIPFSSVSKQGVDEIWEKVEGVLEIGKNDEQPFCGTK
ncbi:MAG: ribosome biogenesis GTP-binding protein YihA/YsxC [Lachnospiraceae bacterium]|nr:ribosome biogenesis GTP-binding protein YihA/YsxC [Lachnospiraceae bacterium]